MRYKLKTLFCIIFTLLLISSSIEKNDNRFGRSLASIDQQKFVETFNIYKSPKTTIFRLNSPSPFQATIDIPKNDKIKCIHNNKEFDLTNKQTINIAQGTKNQIECFAPTTDRSIPLSITYKITPVTVSWNDVNSNLKAGLEKDLMMLNFLKSHLGKTYHPDYFERFPANSNVYKLLRVEIPANKYFVKIADISDRDYVQFISTDGFAAPDITSYKIMPYSTRGEFQHQQAVSDHTLVAPNETRYSLLCGLQSKNNKEFEQITLRGIVDNNSNYVIDKINGVLSCVFNGKKDQFANHQGSFFVTLKIFKSSVAKQWIDNSITRITKDIQQEVNQKNIIENQKTSEMQEELEEIISNLINLNKNDLNLQPLSLCPTQMESTQYQLELRQSIKDRVACSTPLQLSNTDFVAICDKEILILDENLAVKKSTAIENVSGNESTISTISSDDGNVESIIITATDGKIYFLSNDGTIKNSIETEQGLILKPLVTPNKNVVALSYDTPSNIYFINSNGQLINNQEIRGGGTYFNPTLNREDILIGTSNGNLIIFKEDGTFKNEMLINPQNPNNLRAIFTPTITRSGNILLGDILGNLYRVKKDYSNWNQIFSSKQSKKVVGNPVILNNSTIAFITSDNRLHIITESGKIVAINQLDKSFRDISIGPQIVEDKLGNQLIWLSIHGSIYLIHADGTIAGRYTFNKNDIENFNQPLSLGDGRFLQGTNRGIKLFEINYTANIELREILQPCQK